MRLCLRLPWIVHNGAVCLLRWDSGPALCTAFIYVILALLDYGHGLAFRV